MDVWDIDDIGAGPKFSKGERTIVQKHCRFPSFHHITRVDDTTRMILLMTESYKENVFKTGFMRIYLNNDFRESQTNDEEISFDGYNLRFTSAYYPSHTQFYGMAVDINDDKSWLV